MKKRGFTLIELLASLAIISVLVLVVSQIFAVSLNITNKSYEGEQAYKESFYAMAYIDNTVRSSYRIETIDDTGETNVKFFVRSIDNNQISTYVFRTEQKPNDRHRMLYSYTDNISNKSEKGGDMAIARCNSLYLYYDELAQTVHISINGNSTKNNYESIIHLDNRL